jgi:3D (Asp-Asp-Asp) domain-containing protein
MRHADCYSIDGTMLMRTVSKITAVLFVTFSLAGAPKELIMSATAFALRGPTASGDKAQHGIVAADPRILPLGTVIRVRGAGAHSGIYVVGDTGRQIRGHEIDIHVRTREEARRFGRRKVRVQILRRAQ